MTKSYTTDQLRTLLDDFKKALEELGYAKASVNTYVDRARRFLSWVDGDFVPTRQGPSVARQQLDRGTKLHV